MRFVHSLAVFAMLAVPTVAMATPIPIPGLFGTGIGSIGSPDSHYSLISVPSGASSGTATVSSAHPAWFQPGGQLHWINPSGGGLVVEPVGLYTYRQTFSLAGFDPSTAVLNFHLGADDQVDVFLNGNLVISSPFVDYQATTFYQISSGFVGGTNTLDYVVNNTGGTEGLYNEESGTADISAVPEPTSVALLGTGLLSVAGFTRRKSGRP